MANIFLVFYTKVGAISLVGRGAEVGKGGCALRTCTKGVSEWARARGQISGARFVVKRTRNHELEHHLETELQNVPIFEGVFFFGNEIVAVDP